VAAQVVGEGSEEVAVALTEEAVVEQLEGLPQQGLVLQELPGAVVRAQFGDLLSGLAEQEEVLR
jgi:hypothetical protein